jgi:hypothetical protein
MLVFVVPTHAIHHSCFLPTMLPDDVTPHSVPVKFFVDKKRIGTADLF